MTSFVVREASFVRHTMLASSTDQCSILIQFLRFTLHASRFTRHI